jgi:hypothetical protein
VIGLNFTALALCTCQQGSMLQPSVASCPIEWSFGGLLYARCVIASCCDAAAMGWLQQHCGHPLLLQPLRLPAVDRPRCLLLSECVGPSTVTSGFPVFLYPLCGSHSLWQLQYIITIVVD